MKAIDGDAFAVGSRWFLAAVVAAGLLHLAGCGNGNGGSSLLPGGQQMSGGQQAQLTQLSTDAFTNSESQHATEVEPALATFGNNLVTAFQVGRIFSGGASDIGFATSSDSGATWKNGLLPGITQFQGGTYNAASDPSIVYDQAHGVWIVASLAIGSGTDTVVVSRSTDARNWSGPIVASFSADADKDWIACDNNAGSRFYGHCYLEWDDPSKPANGLVWMSTSVDGGMTWSQALNTADLLAGLGGQPVVGANGIVIVPIENADGTQMRAFTSIDGGASWAGSIMISTITDHMVAGNMRTSALPSAAVDADGRVYVVWQDCRFRANCVSNDIVLSTSSDGVNWSAPVGIPIETLTTPAVDHFIPALAVSPATGSSSAALALTYYFYPNAACTAATCQLQTGYIASGDGGNTWGTATTLAGPMSLSWLPNTVSGVMVGDYVATAYSNAQPHAVFAVAQAKAGSVFNEAIYTTANALSQMHEARRRVMPAHTAVTQHSDHPPRRFYDLEHEYPIPPRK